MHHHGASVTMLSHHSNDKKVIKNSTPFDESRVAVGNGVTFQFSITALHTFFKLTSTLATVGHSFDSHPHNNGQANEHLYDGFARAAQHTRAHVRVRKISALAPFLLQQSCHSSGERKIWRHLECGAGGEKNVTPKGQEMVFFFLCNETVSGETITHTHGREKKYSTE